MSHILVGTCSWTAPTLIESGRFYPSWAGSAEARLQYYASQFPIVEVDSSYYALLNERTSGLWARRTGEKFIFDIKAFRLFTQHPTPLSAFPRDIREALPEELKEKTNVYSRDVPTELTDELWQRFERALLPLDNSVSLVWYSSSFRPGSIQAMNSVTTSFPAKRDFLSTALRLNFGITRG